MDGGRKRGGGEGRRRSECRKTLTCKLFHALTRLFASLDFCYARSPHSQQPRTTEKLQKKVDIEEKLFF